MKFWYFFKNHFYFVNYGHVVCTHHNQSKTIVALFERNKSVCLSVSYLIKFCIDIEVLQHEHQAVYILSIST